MKRLAPVLISVFCLPLPAAMAVPAGEVAVGAGEKARIEQIHKILHERFPAVFIERIEPSPIAGLYAVVSDSEIVYTNSDASFLLNGRILDTQTKEDLTTKRWNELNRIDFSSLPLNMAIKRVKGDGRRRLAIFADPRCPYCQALEGELKDVTNVTIYVFLLPLEDIHPGARDMAQKIWCAKDPATAWTDWMLDKVSPAAAPCKPPAFDQLLELGDKLKVTATPTLVFSSGQRYAGTMSRQQIEESLESDRPRM